MPPTDANVKDSRKTRASRQTLLVVLLALGLFAVFLWTDSDLCLIKNTTGIPCPGCGLTRATLAMMTGNWEAVWTYHPLAPIITPIAAGFMGMVVVRLFRGHPHPLTMPRWLPVPLWWLLAFLMVALYAGRLMGYFGGHPDPIDLWGSQPGRLLLWFADRVATTL
jgi:hypothetical protein